MAILLNTGLSQRRRTSARKYTGQLKNDVGKSHKKSIIALIYSE